jgi:F0F1-type ATP synthase assembly protein I
MFSRKLTATAVAVVAVVVVLSMLGDGYGLGLSLFVGFLAGFVIHAMFAGLTLRRRVSDVADATIDSAEALKRIERSGGR